MPLTAPTLHRRACPWPAAATLAVAVALVVGCATGGPTAPVDASGKAAGAAAIAAAAAASSAAAAASAATQASATVAATAVAPAASGAQTPWPAARVAPPVSALKAFDEVVAGATRRDGHFAVWQRDDKLWLELQPADFGREFFLSPKLRTGLGDARFYGGAMADEQLVAFRRVHNQVQLIAINAEYVAQAGTPTGRAVEAAFSPSLLASAAVLSQPRDGGAVLVDANALFVSDLLGLGAQLQRRYRQSYAFDARHSAVTGVRASADLLVLEVQGHYASGAIAPAPATTPPVPDPRSLFLNLHYSLARLPPTVMAPRKADARLGHFTTQLTDFSDDLARTPRRRFVNRWRLEKADPTAAVSDPVRPITYWLDPTVPEKYRAAITAGVLEWNKAFEPLGFRNALRVAVAPPGADFDTLDFGRASIRWMTNATPSFGAIGPSHVDPRSGEILDADIAIESLSSRAMRAARQHVLAPLAAASTDAAQGVAGRGQGDGPRAAHAHCEYGDHAAEQLGYALDVLAARGEGDMNAPEVERFVQDYLKDVTMHEVGHTLGLRHNFRASRLYSSAQLADAAFTARHGLGGSVMDYAPVNLAAPGVPAAQRPAPFNTTLGPYDHWAIEYAYRPLAPGLSAEAEAALLRSVAARSGEPELAYGSDEDQFLGIDPESLRFDLGGDVIAFARHRVAIARELIARQESRQLDAGEDYAVLRRAVNHALRDVGRVATLLTRQIGGVRTLRDHAGSGRDPLTPLPAARQRAALDLLATEFLAPHSFAISPTLQRRLAIDYQERSESLQRGDTVITDFSMVGQLGDLQRSVLGQLMSEAVALRLLDSQAKSPGDALPLAELYARLEGVVWSELARPGDIAPARRELQREHMNRLAAQLLRPASLGRADARGLLRAQSQQLLARLRSAAQRSGRSVEARAHLRDSADTLQQALEAKLVRSGA